MAAAPNPLASTAGGGGLALQGPSGDSLTNFIRSIENLTGLQGQGILNKGLGQADAGINAAAPVVDLLTKLVKGDQGDVTEAAQPQIDQIAQQFDQIRNLVSLQPRGGGKTTALAEAPFQKAGQIQRTEGALRSGATSELGGLATRLAGLGLQEAGIGEGLEGLSSNIALTKTGINQSNTFAKQFDEVLQGIGALI